MSNHKLGGRTRKNLKRKLWEQWNRIVNADSKPYIICSLCGRALPLSEATLEHIIPIANGGTNNINNLTLACQDCNKSRGNKSLRKLKASSVLSRVSNAELTCLVDHMKEV